MEILPITNQANKPTFEAVIPKYLKRAEREYCRKCGMVGDILECLRADVYFKQVSPQDGIDTIEAIKTLAGKTNPFMEHVLEGFVKFRDSFNP